MKKNLKKKLLTTMAILLTTLIILASGGTVIAIYMLGGTGLSLISNVLRINNQTKKEVINQQIINYNTNKNYSKNEQKIVYTISELNLQNKKDNSVPHELTDPKEIKITEILPKIETIDAITEKEKVKRLIRKNR